MTARGGRVRADVTVAVAFVVLAGYLTGRLWLDGSGMMLRANRQDDVFFEWMLANSVHTVRYGLDPLFTGLLNAPYGVNLMANTSVWGLALPLVPVTALAGPAVSFRVLETVALAGTGYAWYHVLSRYALRSRLAAAVAAGLCAFAPGMVDQDTGHPNVAAQFLLPFIVLAVLRLGTAAHPVRAGLVLAALVAYQVFVNEEVLLLGALALAVFVAAYAAQRPAQVRARLPRAAVGLATTGTAAGLVLAYPLYRQFLGRQSYRGLPRFVRDYNTDLLSYGWYASGSLAGARAGGRHLAQGVAEQNTFYGLGLLAVVAVAVVWLWRHPVVRALAVTGLVFGLLSLGRFVVVGGHRTRVPGPWWLLSRLPLLDTVVPTRLSLVVVPCVGLVVGFFADRLRAGAGPVGTPAGRRAAQLLGFGALVLALLPIVPRPLAVSHRHRAPALFAAGAWRAYVPAGGTVGLLPFGWRSDVDMMQWQAEQRLRFAILNGYFLGPDPRRADRRGTFGGGSYLITVLLDGHRTEPVPVTARQRLTCLAELRSWHTAALVLPDAVPDEGVTRATADGILGRGRHVAGTWLWPVPGGPPPDPGTAGAGLY